MRDDTWPCELRWISTTTFWKLPKNWQLSTELRLAACFRNLPVVLWYRATELRTNGTGCRFCLSGVMDDSSRRKSLIVSGTKPSCVIALLDVKVLIALFDPAHIHHEAAHRWFESNRKHRWATCPLTENAFVRILSNPSYPGQSTTIEDAALRLRTFCSEREHAFWPDSLGILEPGRFR